MLFLLLYQTAPVLMTPPSAPPPSLLKQQGIPAVLGGRTLSAFASQVQAVAVGWQVYALTHSAAALGFVGLAQFLPMVLFIFPAGHAADQHNRQRIVISCQVIDLLLDAEKNAIAELKKQADTVAASLGLHVVRFSNVTISENPIIRPMPMMMSMARSADASAAAPSSTAQTQHVHANARATILLGP